jgi:two-component system, NtrC family, sensor kinase
MNERMVNRLDDNGAGQKCTQVLRSFGNICPWCKDKQVLRDEIGRSEVFNSEDNRWYYIVNTPIYNQDSSISRMVMIQDVTEKKESEIRLIMSERLAALGQMASGIAHEINNPLATISACAEGLINRMKKGRSDPDVMENYLKIISEEVVRCKSITKTMLSFVRKTDYEKKDIDIHHVLEKTLELIGIQGRLKKVEVIKNYNVTPVIFTSEGELRQVFLSIIVNALDAMDETGTLTIKTGIEDKMVSVKINDTGPGMSPEMISRIFDPFFTTKSEKGGVGLGLSIANKIITDNKGRIQVSSKKDGGATFTILLPVKHSGNMPYQ